MKRPVFWFLLFVFSSMFVVPVMLGIVTWIDDPYIPHWMVLVGAIPVLGIASGVSFILKMVWEDQL